MASRCGSVGRQNRWPAHRRSPWRVSLLRYARLPRPASTAAPPIPNSRPSCSPAVPPPPVDGGPAGTAGAVVVCGDAVVACAVAVVVCGDAVVACAVAVVVCGDAAPAGGGVVVCPAAGGGVVVCAGGGVVVVCAGGGFADAVGLAGVLGEVVHAE